MNATTTRAPCCASPSPTRQRRHRPSSMPSVPCSTALAQASRMTRLCSRSACALDTARVRGSPISASCFPLRIDGGSFPLPRPRHQCPHHGHDRYLGEQIHRPRPQEIQYRRGGRLPVQVAVVGAEDDVEGQREHHPRESDDRREPVVALITPDIGTPAEGAPDFPHHLFVTFFALHVLVVWAAIYLTWGQRMRPRWRDYRFAAIVGLAWVL